MTGPALEDVKADICCGAGWLNADIGVGTYLSVVFPLVAGAPLWLIPGDPPVSAQATIKVTPVKYHSLTNHLKEECEDTTKALNIFYTIGINAASII